MADFDNILNKGKAAALNSLPIKDLWLQDISVIIGYLHHLNDLYKDKTSHNVNLDLCECEICGKPNYVLIVNDIDDEEKKLYYCHGSWKVFIGGVYRCPNCIY
jgi:hypothetical protein